MTHGSIRFAVNAAFLFTEHAYLDRFAAIAEAGFRAVELPWPAHDLDQVRAAIEAAGLEVVQLNADAGDLAAGERGFANDPARVSQWRAAVEQALSWGRQLGHPACNLLVGNHIPGVEVERQWATLTTNLVWALTRAKALDLRLLVEVLNDRDTPDYLLTRLEDGAALVREIGDPRLRLQFDTYHVATMHGDPASSLGPVQDLVGHVQLADAPGRHEPGSGRADLAGFLDALVTAGYRGWVSLEYHPSADTPASLAWLPSEQRSAALTSASALRLGQGTSG